MINALLFALFCVGAPTQEAYDVSLVNGALAFNDAFGASVLTTRACVAASVVRRTAATFADKTTVFDVDCPANFQGEAVEPLALSGGGVTWFDANTGAQMFATAAAGCEFREQ